MYFSMHQNSYFQVIMNWNGFLRPGVIIQVGIISVRGQHSMRGNIGVKVTLCGSKFKFGLQAGTSIPLTIVAYHAHVKLPPMRLCAVICFRLAWYALQQHCRDMMQWYSLRTAWCG